MGLGFAVLGGIVGLILDSIISVTSGMYSDFFSSIKNAMIGCFMGLIIGILLLKKKADRRLAIVITDETRKLSDMNLREKAKQMLLKDFGFKRFDIVFSGRQQNCRFQCEQMVIRGSIE